ncbi:hypothetical protein FRC02_000977 [Tulasnella sp. 418]|nr:hypothetical protein FRC02_000977 [Tulasnella sp. 418]
MDEWRQLYKPSDVDLEKTRLRFYQKIADDLAKAAMRDYYRFGVTLFDIKGPGLSNVLFHYNYPKVDVLPTLIGFPEQHRDPSPNYHMASIVAKQVTAQVQRELGIDHLPRII